MYKRILLAVDGSENSLRATDEAVKIAALSDDSLIEIIYVVDFEKVKDEVLHSQSKTGLHHTRSKHIIPVKERIKAKNINYEVNIINGYPGPKIIEHANDEKTDLLVIGSRGLNTLQGMFLGSVSHKVVQRVNPPVMIVK